MAVGTSPRRSSWSVAASRRPARSTQGSSTQSTSLTTRARSPLPQVDVLDPRNDKKKRQRQGYEDGISTTYAEKSAAEFVMTDKPVELLGRTTSLTFGEPGARAEASASAAGIDSSELADVARRVAATRPPQRRSGTSARTSPCWGGATSSTCSSGARA